MSICSCGWSSKWKSWEIMGRDPKSPPKDKKLQFIGRKSMIRRNISTPSFVASPLGTPKIPPNIGLLSTRKTFSNGKTPQTPLFRTPPPRLVPNAEKPTSRSAPPRADAHDNRNSAAEEKPIASPTGGSSSPSFKFDSPLRLSTAGLCCPSSSICPPFLSGESEIDPCLPTFFLRLLTGGSIWSRSEIPFGQILTPLGPPGWTAPWEEFLVGWKARRGCRRPATPKISAFEQLCLLLWESGRPANDRGLRIKSTFLSGWLCLSLWVLKSDGSTACTLLLLLHIPLPQCSGRGWWLPPWALCALDTLGVSGQFFASGSLVSLERLADLLVDSLEEFFFFLVLNLIGLL